jgi:1-acyl-sn-glycerol-3-phosphate acyltransferase
MRQTAGIIWKTIFLLHFTITLVLLYPFFAILLSRRSWHSHCFRLMRFWAHLLIMPMGIFYRTRYHYKPARGRKYIYVSNHTSYLDIIISYCVIEDFFIYMGKQELSKVPLFNVFFKSMNILVDRKSRIGSHKAYKRAEEELSKGHSLILYPEGTISKEAPRMRPFKTGAFRLAIEAGVPIVPITFVDNWKRLQDRAFFQGQSGPGLVHIVVHPPVPTAGRSIHEVQQLSDEVKHIIQSGFNPENQ